MMIGALAYSALMYKVKNFNPLSASGNVGMCYCIAMQVYTKRESYTYSRQPCRRRRSADDKPKCRFQCPGRHRDSALTLIKFIAIFKDV